MHTWVLRRRLRGRYHAEKLVLGITVKMLSPIAISRVFLYVGLLHCQTASCKFWPNLVLFFCMNFVLLLLMSVGQAAVTCRCRRKCPQPKCATCNRPGAAWWELCSRVLSSKLTSLHFIYPAVQNTNAIIIIIMGHGTRWLLNWFKRLADGSLLSPITAERQYFCSSACPLPFNGEMRSPSSARSLPPINHPLQLFLA